jgi:hypothetical protein
MHPGKRNLQKMRILGGQMKLSTLAWLAAIIVMTYYLASLGSAYYQAVNALIDARQSQAASMLMEK